LHPGVFLIDPDISEEIIVSIFRAEEYAKQETSRSRKQTEPE
jgi:hypothetical protein